MVSVVFIEGRDAETKLLYNAYAHVADITNQSPMRPYNDLRTVQNRSPTVMAHRSELAVCVVTGLTRSWFGEWKWF